MRTVQDMKHRGDRDKTIAVIEVVVVIERDKPMLENTLSKHDIEAAECQLFGQVLARCR